MRLVVAMFVAVALSIVGFSLALFADPKTEGEKIMAINRAHDAGDAFTKAWNEWAEQHDRWETSVDDKVRFKKVRRLWKEFDRLYRATE